MDFIIDKMERFHLAPKDLIFVVEGPNSKLLRTSISDTYKANRKGKMPDEQYTEINKCRDMVLAQFLKMGSRTVTQPGSRRTTSSPTLAQKLPSCVIISTDGDLQQCISDKAHLFYNGKLDDQRYLHGIFPSRYTTLYKALVGDSSDNIKGARGFGEAAFRDLYIRFGDEGCDAMIELIEQRRLEELHEDVPALPALQRIIDDRENVYTQYDLARQYPEKVNTWRRPLEWKAGVVMEKDSDTYPALVKYSARRKVVHAANRAATYGWFREQVKDAAYVGLDIETSSSEESDEWQARKVKKEIDSEDIGVDMLGHELTGLSLTFGPNDNFSVYFAVDHVEEPGVQNVKPEEVLEFVKLIPQTTPLPVHHSYFELTVLERTWGDIWRDNGWHGFLPNVHDTRLLASHVDENGPQGLKELSLNHLGYRQTTYEEVTKGRKMNQMTAAETLDYGTDDTRTCSALYNHFRCLMEIEGTWDIFLQVEQDPAYLTALAFNQGTPISMERLLELEREDKEAYDKGWDVLKQFLISKGWAGTVCPQASSAADITPSFMKDCYSIVTGIPRDKEEREEAGIENAFLDTRARLPEKMLALMDEDAGMGLLSGALRRGLAGDPGLLNDLLKSRFDGEPKLNLDSPPQMRKLLYEVMGLPIRLRKKPTDNMRAAGIREGNPRADDLAVQWAAQNDAQPGSESYGAIKALQAMKVAHTRQKMFYTPYRRFQHWKDNLIHAHMNQNAAATRRYTSAGPNLQQLPKHPKATGEPAKFREVYVPHHRKAVIVSLDFKAQELILIGEFSQDPNMLSCFVGDDLKDMHTLTAAGILKKKALAGRVEQLWTTAGRTGVPEDAGFRELVEEWKAIDYAGFKALAKSEWGRLYKTLRALGKKTNFTTEYGAQAPKLAETLLVDEDEAQQYIEAKYAAFPRAEEWKREVTEEYHRTGVATTLMGAIRHLAEPLRSGNKWEIGKAERQAVNFKIQGSAAEQTKLAMGRMWRAGLCFKYDARFIGPIHDEVVFSVAIVDLIAFLREVHALMTAPYATMKLPVVSSISIGLNFGQQIEVGEAVNEEFINDVLYNGYLDEEGEKKPPLFPMGVLQQERLAA
jgi:DNA polymerase I-like protein with 3'-5' exonuclease and polymerase domains